MTAIDFAEGRDLVRLYDCLAPSYEQLHRRWLHYAGGEAQAALEAAVRVALNPGAKLLDAGCGTGQFARRLLADGVAPGQIVLADPSQAMLACCSDLPVRKSSGRLEDLPFENAEFDIVTCAWALETVSRPYEALKELCRVLKPGGMLCLTFCADRSSGSLLHSMMRQALTRRGTGRFLNAEHIKRTLETMIAGDVKVLPLAGPAATLIARCTQA